MNLIEYIEKDGLGVVDSQIDTLLSTLFFSGEKVIKVYKHKQAFYGDLADPVFRKEFYFEDFTWNNTFSPNVYMRLVGVVIENDALKEVEYDKAEDFFIEMKNIDSTRNITNLFNKKELSVSNITDLTVYIAQKVKELTLEKREKLISLFSSSWKHILSEDIEDLRGWMYMVESDIKKNETDEIIDFLKKTIGENEYITNFDSSQLAVSIDNNCDNLLILNGKPAFIDIMPPKYNWRVCDEFFNISRTAVDCLILGDNNFYEAVYRTYDTFGTEPPEEIKIIYEIRSSLIQWPYRCIIGQHELAEKYKQFTLERIKKLKLL